MERVLTIAINTYRESVRSKILYSLFFFALLMVAVSAFFGSVTIGDQVKVIKDFGLFSISMFTVMYAVISGSTLLSKELTQKTIYNILAKPVARWEFLLGKYLGMLLTGVVMLALMGSALSVFVACFEGEFSFSLIQGYIHILFELVIVCAATIFFSSVVVTPMLSGFFAFAVFLSGRSVELLHYFIDNGMVSEWGARILQLVYWILPQLQKINIVDRVVYNQNIDYAFMMYCLLYSLGYAGVLLVLSHFIFSRREFA